jgi:hypothetical protein
LVQVGIRKGSGNESRADIFVKVGPTLRVDIGLKSRSDFGERPDLPKKRVLALIDTGAGGDGIDDALARSLGLPVTDEGEISGVGGRHRAQIYTARIYIPSLDKLLFQPFTGMKLEEGRQHHRVILGRSFLRHYRLSYDGSTGDAEIDPA